MESFIEKIKFKRSNEKDLLFLLNNSPNGIKNFRYFYKREVKIIHEHLFSFIYYLENKPVAYFHIEQDEDINWFGIIVSDKYTGLGLSKIIMDHATKICDALNVELSLSVDKDNEKAINLYKKYGFSLLEEKEKYYLLKRNRR